MNAPVRTLHLETEIREGPPPLLWALGAMSVAVLFWLDFLNLKHGITSGGAYWGRDFINVWTGGQLVRSGHVSMLYQPEAYSAYQRTLFGPVNPHNYSYPPVSFPLAALFSLLPYWLALAAWLSSTGALFAYACRRVWPRRAGPACLALLTPAALLNVWAGHYGFLVGALFLLGWQKLDRSPVQAGILFGCMLLKPHLAMLVPVALIARGEWRALGSGAVTVALLVGGTSLLFGWGSWHQFLFGVSATQSSMIDAGTSFYGLMSTSTATAVLRWTDAKPLAFIAQGVVSLGAATLLFCAARRKAPTLPLGLLTATCTFLALPYGFNYDMVVVMIGAVAVMIHSHRRWQRLAGGTAFLAPSFGILTAYWSVPIMALSLGLLAWTQWRQIVDQVE